MLGFAPLAQTSSYAIDRTQQWEKNEDILASGFEIEPQCSWMFCFSCQESGTFFI